MKENRLKLMFSHVSVRTMFALWLLGLALVIGSGNAHLLWLAPLGVLAQMLNEYMVHRFLFHWPAPRSQFWFDVLYRVHYGHHDFPDKPSLFFVPVWFALPMALLHYAIAALVFYLLGFGSPLIAAAAFTFVGGVAAFLAYEWFHMTAHVNVRKTAIERHVTRLHGMHHFRNYQRWFHVSPGGEVIDRLMGTAIPDEALKQKGRMVFLTTLGLKPDDPRLVSARRRLGPHYGISEAEMARAAASS